MTPSIATNVQLAFIVGQLAFGQWQEVPPFLSLAKWRKEALTNFENNIGGTDDMDERIEAWQQGFAFGINDTMPHGAR